MKHRYLERELKTRFYGICEWDLIRPPNKLNLILKKLENHPKLFLDPQKDESYSPNKMILHQNEENPPPSLLN